MKQNVLRGISALMISLGLVASLALAAGVDGGGGGDDPYTQNPDASPSTSISPSQSVSPSPSPSPSASPSPSPKPTLKGLTVVAAGGSGPLAENGKRQLTVVTDPANMDLSGSTITWEVTSGTGIVEVSGSGLVVGRRPGTAEITASVGNIKSPSYTVEVSGVVLRASPADGKILVNKTLTLTPTLYGSAIGLSSPEWVSSDPAVAHVVTGGKVTGRAPGTAIITVTFYDGKIRYTSNFQVTVGENTEGQLNGGSVTAGGTLPFSGGIAEDISAACRKATGSGLRYVSNLSVSTKQGILYYGYNSPGDTGFGVGGTEQYYYTPATGQRELSRVTFVPRPEFSGTAEITYVATGANGGSLTGTIQVKVSAIEDVNYTTTVDAPVILQSGDFNTISRVRTGHDLSYVVLELPPANQGVLYYNYNGNPAYAEKLVDGTQYFRSRSPYIDSITFVPAQGYTGTVRIGYRGMDTAGAAFTGRASIVVSTGTTAGRGDVNYSAQPGERVDFTTAGFNNACQAALGERLDYVYFPEPSSSQGRLYYNYRNGSGSEVDSATRYYRSGGRTIANVSFVPAGSEVQSVSIPFTGYGTSSGERFEGTVVIDYTGKGGGDISYSTGGGRAAEFNAADFNELCQSKLGSGLDYVCFDDLPTSSRGRLYYNHTSSQTGSRVYEDTRLYRVGSPSLSRTAFVPNSSYSGTVSIGFTGYGTNGGSFTGTVEIQVDGDSGGRVLRYSVRPGDAVDFDSRDFDSVCQDATGGRLNYVRFELPPSSRGALYYRYGTSDSAEVSESVSYYRTGSSRLLEDVSFVPRSGYEGTVELSYTGYSSGSGQYSGTVEITVASPRADTIHYSGSTAPVYLNADSFRQACSGALSGSLSHIRFAGVPDGSAGRLYTGYSGVGTGSQVIPGSNYYVNGSPSLDEICFVPRAGYQGTESISYTGFNGSGEQVSGTIEITISSGSGTAAAAGRFSDMGSYSWAAAAVDYLCESGVVNGIGNGQFGPGQTIQRCDFTLMLCRAFGLRTDGSESFPDVQQDSYYAWAVATAKDLGVVTGNDGLFMPTNALSRQDAMLMLKRAMQVSGWSVPDGSADSLSSYADGVQVSGYARGAVAAMVEMGIVNGNSANQLKPWEPITRAEMAVILYRALTR